MRSESATCCITIRGPLEPVWADYVGHLILSAQAQQGRIVSSTLSGPIPDLAAFMGIVTYLYDTGVVVLAAHYQQLPAID